MIAHFKEIMKAQLIKEIMKAQLKEIMLAHIKEIMLAHIKEIMKAQLKEGLIHKHKGQLDFNTNHIM